MNNLAFNSIFILKSIWAHASVPSCRSWEELHFDWRQNASVPFYLLKGIIIIKTHAFWRIASHITLGNYFKIKIIKRSLPSAGMYSLKKIILPLSFPCLFVCLFFFAWLHLRKKHLSYFTIRNQAVAYIKKIRKCISSGKRQHPRTLCFWSFPKKQRYS